MWRNILLWVWRGITILLNLVAIASLFNYSASVTYIFGFTIRQFFVFIALLASIIIIIHLIVINTLEKNKRPKIIVKPKVFNRRAILEVINKGGAAIFTAKGRVIATFPNQELYTMYWESVKDTRCLIDGNDGIASILVGEIANQDLKGEAETTIYKNGLQLYKLGTSGEQVFSVNTGIHSENGYTLSDRECIVEVTITSQPPLRQSFSMKRYLLNIAGSNLTFTEELNSNSKYY
jgi:hypothetical protein